MGRRRGSFLLEAVISIALLATALVGITRLSSSSAELSLRADRQLAATLAADNTLARLRSIPLEQLAEKVSEITNDITSQSGCEVEAELTPIQSPPGVHVTVTVRVEDQVELVAHDWRLEQAADEPDGGTSPADEDSADEDSADEDSADEDSADEDSADADSADEDSSGENATGDDAEVAP